MSAVLAEVMSRLDELHRNPASVTGKADGLRRPGRDDHGAAGRATSSSWRDGQVWGRAQPLDCESSDTERLVAKWALSQVGDALASIDGAPSIVTGIYPQGVRQVYRITFSDGRSAEAAPSTCGASTIASGMRRAP